MQKNRRQKYSKKIKACQGQSKILVLIVVLFIIITGVIIYNYNQLPNGSTNTISTTNTATKINPKIEVTPESYDLGDVIYGEVAKHTFTVKNLGDKPLEILRLSTSCGCTTADIAEEDKIIKQGKGVDMIVMFDPAVMDEPISGPVERVVYIKTNDPDRPEIEVDITANVIIKNN